MSRFYASYLYNLNLNFMEEPESPTKPADDNQQQPPVQEQEGAQQPQ